jgi:hypothetical protein
MSEAFKDANLIFAEGDGYAPAALGGVVNVKWGDFTFENIAENEAELFTLPEGAQIVGWVIAPGVGFNGSTPVLDVGDGTTADRFADGIALPATTAHVTEGFNGSEMFVALAEETTFYATYAEASGGSAGAAKVGVFYVIVAE